MNEILFIDARKLGKMVSRRLRVFEDADLEKIADAYHTWRNHSPLRGAGGVSILILPAFVKPPLLKK